MVWSHDDQQGDGGRLRAFALQARRLAESIASVDEAVDAVARTACELVGDLAGVLLLEPGSDNFVIAAACDLTDADYAHRWKGKHVSGARAISSRVVDTQAAFRWHVSEPLKPEYTGRLRIATGEAVDAVLAAPLWVRGRAIGVVAMARRPPAEPYTDEDEAYAVELASLGALSIDNARLAADYRMAMERMRVLFDSSGPVAVTDQSTGAIFEVNAAFLELFGVERAAVIGRPLADVAPVSDAPPRPLPHQRPDGRTIHVEHRPYPVYDPRVRAHLFIDRTNRVVAEVEQQRLLRRLAGAENKERARVARALHDDLGQLLTSASLFAKDLERPGADVARRAQVLRSIISEALVAVRRMAWTLHPAVLEHASLGEAIQQLACALGKNVSFDVGSDMHFDAIDPDVAGEIYRIVQEALTNARRHAPEAHVAVCAHREGESVVVEVSDDGPGFDPEQVDEGHLGLVVMQERARLAGVDLVLSSRPGAGTTVRLSARAGAPTAVA